MKHSDYTVALTVTYGDRGHYCNETVMSALAAGANRIVVVLNLPAKRAIRIIEDRWNDDERVVLLHLDRNTGSAEGFSRGILKAIELSQDCHIWLLDDDNVVEPDALNLLYTAISCFPESVASANRLANPYHQKLASGICEAKTVYPRPGSFMYFDVFHSARRLLGNPDRRRGSDVSVVLVPSAPYGGLLVPASVIERVGLPRRSHQLYEDDTEFTTRITQMGIPIYWVRAAKVADQDPKWNSTDPTESSGGIIGMVRSPDRARFCLATRNRCWYDLVRVRGSRVLSVRLAVNFCIYFSAICLISLFTLQIAVIQEFTKAAYRGLDSENLLGPKCFYAHDIHLVRRA